jgi:hypothetical protein
LSNGIAPKVTFLKSNLSESEAIAFEVEMILKFGRIDLRTGCLCHHTDGGEGISGASPFRPWMSEDHKVKISLANSKTHSSPEYKAKARASVIAYKGRPVVAINPTTNEVVYSFACMHDAEKKGFHRTSIYRVLSGERNLYRGYLWRDA